MNITLTNSTKSSTFDTLSPPLEISSIEGVSDIVTLDMNVSTYFTQNKRQWRHTFPYMEESEYQELKSFYDNQWTAFKYPLLTIEALGIINQPVRMAISSQNIIDKCGRVADVEVTFRETRQLT